LVLVEIRFRNDSKIIYYDNMVDKPLFL